MERFRLESILTRGKAHNGYSEWDSLWEKQGTSRFLSFMRRNVVAREVAHYCNRFFGTGVYCECGCGSGESSVLLKKQGRTLIGLDLSRIALSKAKEKGIFDYYVEGDILDLPFRKGSLDGIWNYGVMEHFSEEQLGKALSEFKRVLKPGAHAVMMWPYWNGTFSIAYRRVSGRMKRRFYPAAPSVIRSREQVKGKIQDAGLKPVSITLSPFLLFSNYAVVAQV